MGVWKAYVDQEVTTEKCVLWDRLAENVAEKQQSQSREDYEKNFTDKEGASAGAEGREIFNGGTVWGRQYSRHWF